MTGSYYERIAAFLSDYMEMNPGHDPIPPDPIYITDAISMMTSEYGFTKAELKREALEKYDVIIADRFFLMEG